MRVCPWIVLLVGCAAPKPAPQDQPHSAPDTTRPDPVIACAESALAKRDLAGACAGLERGRWLADDRARAALLLYGCLLLEGRTADAVKVLREYLEKTTRPVNPRDRIAIRLLRHHATGGGLASRNPEEALYFGLYALKALDEPTTARPDLDLAARDAPEPERLLARMALGP